MSKRYCTKCRVEKLLDDDNFYHHPGGRGGYASRCKECMNKQAKQWQAKNRDKTAAANRRWREHNPDKVREANRKPRKRSYDPAKNKKWREGRLKKPGYRESVNQKANARAAALRAFLNQYKLERGCVDCGYNEHPAGLEFDHVDGTKELNVCLAKSRRQALAEIEKCVVRCAICHRIRHYDEGHSVGPPSASSG